MYSIKKIDGKECNITKVASIAIDFNKLKMFYLVKESLDIKWKEFKAKSIN